MGRRLPQREGMSKKPMLLFLLRCTLLFALLVAPWPGWYQAYGEAFRVLAGKCLRHPGGGGLAKFTRNPPSSDGLDLTIYLTNASLVNETGAARATWVKLKSRVLGLIPTALLIALIFATPVSWWRRARALGWGLVWCHGYILAALFITICQQYQAAPSGLGVFEWSPLGRRIIGALHEILVEHIGTQMAFTVVVWVLVTFSREDWPRWTQAITAATKSRGPLRGPSVKTGGKIMPPTPRARLAWRPRPIWALVMVVLAVGSIIGLSRVSEFIYWQF